MSHRRAAVRDLAERLAEEYAGSLPPGRVLAIVFRTAHQLSRVPSLTEQDRLDLCERAVLGALVTRVDHTTTPRRRGLRVA